jgi:hypothetical protein
MISIPTKLENWFEDNGKIGDFTKEEIENFDISKFVKSKYKKSLQNRYYNYIDENTSWTSDEIERVLALADIEQYSYRYIINNLIIKHGKTVTDGNNEHLIVTDDEADEKWDCYLENSVDEAKDQIPKHLQYYFDEDSYLEDLKINRSRGSDLNWHDGNEHEVNVFGTTYYIYRQ